MAATPIEDGYTITMNRKQIDLVHKALSWMFDDDIALQELTTEEREEIMLLRDMSNFNKPNHPEVDVINAWNR